MDSRYKKMDKKDVFYGPSLLTNGKSVISYKGKRERKRFHRTVKMKAEIIEIDLLKNRLK